MGVHVVVSPVHHDARDIGAVVAGALQAVEQVGPDEAGLDGAAALLQPLDVADAEGFLQIVGGST